jgi:hypothetical protein
MLIPFVLATLGLSFAAESEGPTTSYGSRGGRPRRGPRREEDTDFGFVPLVAPLLAGCARDRSEEAERAREMCAFLLDDPNADIPDDVRDELFAQVDVQLEGFEDDPRVHDIVRALALGAAYDPQGYRALLDSDPPVRLDDDGTDRDCDEGADLAGCATGRTFEKNAIYIDHKEDPDDHAARVWVVIQHELFHYDQMRSSRHVVCPPGHVLEGNVSCDADWNGSWAASLRAAETFRERGHPDLVAVADKERRDAQTMVLVPGP